MLNRTNSILASAVMGSALFAPNTGDDAPVDILTDDNADGGIATATENDTENAQRAANQQRDNARDLIASCVERFLPMLTPTPRGTPEEIAKQVRKANLRRDVLETVLKFAMPKIKAGDATEDYVAQVAGEWLGDLDDTLEQLIADVRADAKLAARCLEPAAKGVNLPKSGKGVRDVAKVILRVKESAKGVETDVYNALRQSAK
jgi:hypothetical protein